MEFSFFIFWYAQHAMEIFWGQPMELDCAAENAFCWANNVLVMQVFNFLVRLVMQIIKWDFVILLDLLDLEIWGWLGKHWAYAYFYISRTKLILSVVTSGTLKKHASHFSFLFSFLRGRLLRRSFIPLHRGWSPPFLLFRVFFFHSFVAHPSPSSGCV